MSFTVIRGKWKPLVMYCLDKSPKRFGQVLFLIEKGQELIPILGQITSWGSYLVDKKGGAESL